MPDNAHSNAEDDVDRHIAYLVARGLLFTVRDPITDELSYGATPKGQRWLAEHDGWPEPLPAMPPKKTRPAPSPAHAAPRRRLVRRTLLAGVTAAISVPSIAIAGRLIAPQDVDDAPNVVQPDVVVPSEETATTPMEEGRQPTRSTPHHQTARAHHSAAPEASPTPTDLARQQDSRAHAEYIGRHRGRPAKERLEDAVTDAVAGLIKDKHITVHFTLPPAGSQDEVTVHTYARDDDDERCHGFGH